MATTTGASSALLSFSETVRGCITDGVLLVEVNYPPVNALSIDVRAGLLASIAHAANAAAIEAIAIIGAGKIFIGGAKIGELGLPPVEPILPTIVAAIERSAKPVVAAINGAALGGGLEVALAAHRRIAATSASLALPEVKLGIVPGAGGTQRLPRLIGIPAAVDLIATGRTISTEEALTLGILDRIVEGDLRDAAIAEARSLIGHPLRRSGECVMPQAQAEAIDAAVSKALARARGQMAPKEAVRLVTLSAARSLGDGLAEERRTFLRLKESEEAAALRYVFFAERAAAKIAGLEGVKPQTVDTVGVVGMGLMGSGIAMTALDAGFRVIAVEQTEEASANGQARIEALMDHALNAGRSTLWAKPIGCTD